MINRIVSKLARTKSKILFILGSYDFLAYLECIRSYAWSKGHSETDLGSVIRISIFYISELLGDLWPWSDGRVGLYWSTSVVGTPGKAHFERRIDVWRPISSCRPYGKSALKLETVQDFLIKLDIKPLMHLLKIIIFSLNIDIVRLTKILNNLVRDLKKQTYKVICQCLKLVKSFQK